MGYYDLTVTYVFLLLLTRDDDPLSSNGNTMLRMMRLHILLWASVGILSRKAGVVRRRLVAIKANLMLCGFPAHFCDADPEFQRQGE